MQNQHLQPEETPQSDWNRSQPDGDASTDLAPSTTMIPGNSRLVVKGHAEPDIRLSDPYLTLAEVSFMKVKVVTGDLFSSQAQTLVNAVNCVGVMGKGIALEFKTRFPDMFADYAQRCRTGTVTPGKPYLYRRPVAPSILNFPTKRHWREPSSLSDIEAGLVYLEAHYKDWGIESLAVPALGCGYGQLQWQEVGPILIDRLERLDIRVELYAPLL